MKKINLLCTFIITATSARPHNFDLQPLIRPVYYNNNHEFAIDQRKWGYDASNKVWNFGSQKLQIERELQWEASPRKATIVYAGLITSENLP